MSSASHHHPRRRRYRVAPEALGRGYDTFDVSETRTFRVFAPLPAIATAAPAAAAPEAEVLSEKERARRTSRKGMWVCAEILLVLLACLRLNWLFAVYFALIRVWQHLLNLINTLR